MRSVLILQRRMPAYRVQLFERLREELGGRGISLSLLHGTPQGQERRRDDEGSLPWAERVAERHFEVGGSRLTWLPVPKRQLERQDLVVMPHEGGMLANYRILAGRCHPRLAFFGHGDNLQARGRRPMRAVLKRWVSRRVDWWFAYTGLSVRLVVSHGFPAARVTRLDNAIDTAGLARDLASVDAAERDALRARLGLTGQNLCLALGSLHAERRLPFLFSAADRLRRELGDFELLIVGDGPLGGEVRDFAAARPWVRWVGARFGREKALHASLGAAMLNPGLVGLNVLDSFSLGIPMVTTDCGLHSPEIEYLDPGRNGVMTPDDEGAYVETVAALLRDHEARASMAAACRADSSRYTLEGMAGRFRDGIEAALAAPARRP